MIFRPLFIRAVVVTSVCLTLFGCGVPAPATHPSAPPPSRVVLISYDGLGADDLEDLLQRKVLGESGIRKLLESGAYSRVVPVNPTLTSCAHISIATGAPTERTGIVSNAFHLPGTRRTQSTSGFDAPIGTETLWEAALRQGKRVGVITFPGVDGNGPRRLADWGLVYSHPVVRSRMLRLDLKDFSRTTTTLPSFSPPMATSLPWELSIEEKKISKRLVLVALDGTDDQRINYDSIHLRSDSREDTLEPGSWFATSEWVQEADGRHLYGSWSKLIQLEPDLTRVTLYLGPISSTSGYPASYREMIDRELGFWPGPPDDLMAEDWLEGRSGVDPETFIQQTRRFSNFFTEATRLSMRTMPWDLILAYQPVIDEAEHAFRLMNPRQQAFTPENAAAARRVREETYQLVDESVASLSNALGKDGALVVTGDHGLAEVDTSVRVNRILIDWGYVRVVESQVAADTPWVAFTSGSMGHIYAYERREDLGEAAQRLRELRSPDGAAVFERVRLKNDQDHPNTGDIVLYGYPRFAMSSSLGEGVFMKTRFYGQHGGLNHHREYHTMLLATGAGVRPWTRREMSQTEIAGYVSSLLRIEPPSLKNPESPEGTASAPHAAPHR